MGWGFEHGLARNQTRPAEHPTAALVGVGGVGGVQCCRGNRGLTKRELVEIQTKE